jgi:hypothetical protein
MDIMGECTCVFCGLRELWVLGSDRQAAGKQAAEAGQEPLVLMGSCVLASASSVQVAGI